MLPEAEDVAGVVLPVDRHRYDVASRHQAALAEPGAADGALQSGQGGPQVWPGRARLAKGGSTTNKPVTVGSPSDSGRAKEPGLCRFGYCRAAIPTGRGRSVYCSEEHARAAHSTQAAEAAARRAAEAHHQQIATGAAPPVPHLGAYTTANGVVLDGSVILELRALLDGHRAAMTDLVNAVTRPGATAQTIQQYLRSDVLPTDSRLLTVLRRHLPEPEPRS